MQVINHTTINNWKKCLSADGTDAAFGSGYGTGFQYIRADGKQSYTAAAITARALIGWHDLARTPSGETMIEVQPATNANNADASLRVWGFNEFVVGASGIVYLQPVMRAQIDFTSGNVLNAALNLYSADTVTRIAGPAAGIRTYSSTDDTVDDLPGSFVVDLMGSRYLLFDFAINSGAATSFNGLWRKIS